MRIQPLSRRTQGAKRAAFTLLEILVVVTIIVMLAGVGTYYAMNYLESAKVSTAKIGAKKIDDAVQAYKLNHDGELPNNLQVLTAPDEKGGQPLLTADELLDPWKHPYELRPNGQHNGAYKPDIVCKTPSGVEVGNWKD